MSSRHTPLLILATVLVLLDQAAKWLVVRNMALGEAITVIPGFFDLVYVLNRGASFGMLNRGDITWQRWFFIAMTLVAIAVIAYMVRMSKPEERLLRLALGCILGGAVGNLIDRVRQGMVVDFLDFYVGSYHWPAFNVADSAISVGAVLLIVSFYMRGERKPREQG
jgi:signal peptidase II